MEQNEYPTPKRQRFDFQDDKTQVIWAVVLILAMTYLWSIIIGKVDAGVLELAKMALSMFAGMAIGKAMK